MNPKNPVSHSINEPLVSAKHPELFHYTTLSALKGILETNTLWATQATHLNDSSEVTILWRKLEEICINYLEVFISDYLQSRPEEREKFEALGGAIKFAKQDGSMIVEVMHDLLFGDGTTPGMGMPFIVSFATHNNEYHRRHGMLSQWRGYGGDDTVAIIFDSEKLEDLLEFEVRRFEYLSCLIADAIYYRDDMNLVKTFPRLFAELSDFLRQIIGGWGEHDEILQNDLSRLTSELMPAVGRLKHWAFHEENECRVITGVPDKLFRDKFEQHGHREVLFKNVYYRSGVFGSIPYIRLFEDFNEPLPITRVLVGPSINQRANVQRVYELLDGLARNTMIKAQYSNIPYIGST